MPPALEGRFVTTEPPEKGAFSREVTSGSCSPIDCSLPGSFPGKNEVWFYFGKDKLVLKYAPDLFVSLASFLLVCFRIRFNKV